MLTVLLVAKCLEILGVVLLTIPVILDGRHQLIFGRLGRKARSAELKGIIQRVKAVHEEDLVRLRARDLRYVGFGLALVLLANFIEGLAIAGAFS